MDAISFAALREPTPEVADALTRWENDPALIYLSRPNRSMADLEKREVVTLEMVAQRLSHQRMFLIYLDGRLVGEMGYQVDPEHLSKREPGTAWIGITIGEPYARGKGVGQQALRYLEQQIAEEGLGRIELGVFEFNAPARALYEKLGYREIGRVRDFTFWQDRLWDDIRMEKYVGGAAPQP